MPESATDGPDLNGLAAAAVAGAPGFGAIGVVEGSAKEVLSGGTAVCEATREAEPTPGRRSVWPVCTEYGAWMPLTAASSATERLLDRAIE